MFVDGTLEDEEDQLHYWLVEYDAGMARDGETEGATYLNVPMGERRLKHVVFDGHGVFDVEYRVISVVDTSPPSVRAPDVEVTTCIPASTKVYIPSAVSDSCTDNSTIELEGTIVKMKSMDTSLPVNPNQTKLLPVGKSVVRSPSSPI